MFGRQDTGKMQQGHIFRHRCSRKMNSSSDIQSDTEERPGDRSSPAKRPSLQLGREPVCSRTEYVFLEMSLEFSLIIFCPNQSSHLSTHHVGFFFYLFCLQIYFLLLGNNLHEDHSSLYVSIAKDTVKANIA